MEHQLGVALFRHAAVGGHKAGDALLHLLKAVHGLRYAQDQPGVPHRVHRHGGSGHDEAVPRADRQWDADGVPAAQHQRGAGLGDAGNQLCQRKAGLYIAAHRVQQHQQPLDAGVLLHSHQLRDNVLVLGGLLPLRRFHVPFDLANDGQAVDDMAAPGQGDRAQILHVFFFHAVLLCGGVFCRFHAVSPSVAGVCGGSIPRQREYYTEDAARKTL